MRFCHALLFGLVALVADAQESVLNGGGERVYVLQQGKGLQQGKVGGGIQPHVQQSNIGSDLNVVDSDVVESGSSYTPNARGRTSSAGKTDSETTNESSGRTSSPGKTDSETTNASGRRGRGQGLPAKGGRNGRRRLIEGEESTVESAIGSPVMNEEDWPAIE